MKRKLIFILSTLALIGLVIAADSPYARRIRPVVGGFPGSCTENEIAYDMTSHSIAICTNTGYIGLASTVSNVFTDRIGLYGTALATNTGIVMNKVNFTGGAFGANFTVGGTDDVDLLYVGGKFVAQSTSSGSAFHPVTIGVQAFSNFNGTGRLDVANGVESNVQNNSNGVSQAPTLFWGQMVNGGTGTLGQATGVYLDMLFLNSSTASTYVKMFDGKIRHTGSGTIPLAIGLNLDNWSKGSATVTQSEGIHIGTGIDIGTTKFAINSLSTSPSVFSGQLQINTTILQTSNSATAFESGPNGSTNPVLRLVNNTASQADGISITGLAAGNGTTITALSSGANAGFTFTPKGSPTANFLLSSGRLQIGGTSSSFPALRNTGAKLEAVSADGSAFVQFTASALDIANSGKFTSSADGIFNLTNDAGTAGTGWLVTGGGQCFLQADQTNATTTFANINNCTINVVSGRKYSFRGVFYLSDSTAADGAKLDTNGGAATTTNFRMQCTAFDTALNFSTQQTTLAGVFSATTFTGNGMFECYGTIEPSSTSTVIVRFAQNAHTTGTLTLARGSHMQWVDNGP